MKSALELGLERRRRAIDASSGSFRLYDSLIDLENRFPGTSQLGTVQHVLPIDFKFNASPGAKTLAVFFNSQQADDDLKLFTWQRVSQALQTHRLYIADPVLSTSPTIRLGWYSYALGVNFQVAVERLIRGICSKAGVENILFFGSSGGAYPASVLVERFDQSLAVLVCPALRIEGNPNRNAVQAWLRDAVGPEGTIASLAAANPAVVLRSWDGLNRSSDRHRIVIHNRSDVRFAESHVRPYLSAFGVDEFPPRDILRSDLTLLQGDWGNGHVPPPASELERLLEFISSQLSDLANPDFQGFSF